MFSRSVSRAALWLAVGVSALPAGAWAEGPAAAQGAGAAEWEVVVGELGKLGTSLQSADQRLSEFSSLNKLTAKGKTATAAAQKRVAAARAQVQSSLDAAGIMAARSKGDGDAARFRDSNRSVVADAEAALVGVERVTTEPAHVDRAAEERAAAGRAASEAAAARAAGKQESDAKRAEAETARRSAEREAAEGKKADAEQKAEKRKAAFAASLETKKAAEQSAAEARKAAEEERRLAAAATAAAAAEKVRGELGSQITSVERSLTEQHEREKPIRAALAGFLARTNLTSDARNAGRKLLKKLDEAAVERVSLSGQLGAVAGKPGAAKQLKDLDTRGQTLARELTGYAQAQSSLSASPKSFLGGSVGGAMRVDEPIPTCEFTFEPADGKPMQIGIDGGAPRSLPTRARLTSGRHTLVVRRDRAVEERRELLLCGHVATVPVEPLK